MDRLRIVKERLIEDFETINIKNLRKETERVCDRITGIKADLRLSEEPREGRDFGW